jgi:hypothetical protein
VGQGEEEIKRKYTIFQKQPRTPKGCQLVRRQEVSPLDLVPHAPALSPVIVTHSSAPFRFISMNSAFFSMPARGDQAAPQFDLKQPHQLHHYFSDLDLLFWQSDTLDDQERKHHACHYVDFTTSELWELLTEFSDHSQSFADFKLGVFGLYPELAEECRWLVVDLEKLVEERCQIGVHLIGDLGEYYQQFLPIAKFLWRCNRLSDAEQCRMFIRGFQCELQERITDHLQHKFPNHFPDNPYCFGNIHRAAQFVLHATASSHSDPLTNSRPPITQLTISTLLERLIEALQPLKPLLLPHLPAPYPHLPPLDSHLHCAHVPTHTCNFCGSSNHFIRKCPSTAEYIRIGRCKWNLEGKITLPTGSFGARNVPGHFLRDRIHWWHSRNPGHLASDLLTFRAAPDPLPHHHTPTTASNTAASNQISCPTCGSHSRPPPTQSTLNLCPTIEDRIVALEWELFPLQKCDISATTAPQDRSKPLPLCHIPATHSDSENHRPLSEPAAVACLPKSDVAGQFPLCELLIQSLPSSLIIGYAPPHQHNFGTVPKPRRSKKPAPVHYSDPPVYNEKIAPEVFICAMHSDIAVTQSDLLLLSPNLYSMTSDVIT